MSALSANASACSSDPTIGDVCIVASDWCPKYHLPADGRLLQVRDLTALFSVMGNRFGGDGRTTFALPDLRARAAIGVGTATDLPAPVAIAQRVGQQSTTLTSAQLPVHTHTAAFTPTTGSVPVTIPAQAGTLAVDASAPVATTPNGAISGTTVALGAGQTGYLAGVKGNDGTDDVTFSGPYTATDPGSGAARLKVNAQVTGNAPTAAATVPVTTVTGGAVAISNSGLSAPVNVQSPGLGLTYCVAVNGIFPERP